MRYQQGIGVPQTLGVQPTLWKEPESFKPKGFNLPSINAGTSRNYGIAGPVVDTMPSRWGGPSGLTMTPRRARLGVQGLEEIITPGAGSSPSITTPSTSRTMQRTRNSKGIVDPAERQDIWNKSRS